jgi:tetratricopeptide (TPR) repeat protein
MNERSSWSSLLSRVAGGLALTALLSAQGAAQGAQPLPLKRTLSPAAAPGCAATPAVRPTVRRDNAEARRLAAAGQEAGLMGDRAGARDAFAKAAALNPTDDRLAYDLARAHEELNESAAAIREYCRYLSLAPEGREAADVRARLTRLAPRNAVQGSERALERFKVGVANYDRARYDIAWQAFDDVVRTLPGATDALYNRALARAAIGRRDDARKDFEAYIAADPAAADRVAVANVIDQLRRPVFDGGTALRSGMVPGLGQFYTKRPALGVLVMAGVGGAVAAAFTERTGVRLVPYTDPNGVYVPYEEEFRERPYIIPAAAAAVAITAGAAVEAYFYARRTSRPVAAGSPRGVGRVRSEERAVDVLPHVGRQGQVGVGVGLRF